MHTNGKATIALVITVGLGACSEPPVAPHAVALSATDIAAQSAQSPKGTGLAIDNVTGLSLPLIGQVGSVTLNQAVITQLGVVSDLAGNIIGVSAQGVLQLTGGALGSDIVTQNFTTNAQILSSGKGQCDIVTIDLAPIAVDALGKGVFVDVPQGSVTPRASGALGPLLCNLGSALNAPVGQISTAVRGLVNAINQILI